MKIKKIQIIQFLYFLNFIYFAKSTVYTQNKSELNQDKARISIPNTFSARNIDKLLSEAITKIELKLESLINEKMEKLEERINQKLTSLINGKIDKLEETIKQMNNLNKLMLKMDHLSINKMEEKMKLVDHKYKCSNISIPRSCYDLKGCESNIYNLMIPEVSYKPFPAACDLKTLNGGWTIIQRRQDGSENFFRNWTEYAKGFGNVNGEFFIGLNSLHALTSSGDPQELYIMLEDFDGEKRYARYGEFKVDSESLDFKLTVGQYSGNAGDSLSTHNGMKFSTKDRDNDISVTGHCAKEWEGGWWYTKCYYSNLNGQYLKGEKIKTRGGIVWSEFRDLNYSLKFVQMMIRPKIY